MSSSPLLAALLPASLLVAGCGRVEAPSAEHPRRQPPPSFYLGGIQVNEPDLESWLDTLEEVGFNTLAVTVYARQGSWDSARLEWEEAAEQLVPEIRAAKRRGLEVALILRVALEHALEENLFLWHGMIMPAADDDLAAWFERYSQFVERWARIAEAEGVDILGIGSELNALASTVEVDRLPVLEEYYLNAEKQEALHERLLAYDGEIEPSHLKAGWGKTYDSLPAFLDQQSAAHYRWAEQVTFGREVAAINRRRRLLEEHWRRLIAQVREISSSRLTYAANFDQYRAVGFWDALDLIGVNAYFPLRDGLVEVSSTADLLPVFEAAWTRILSELREFRRSRKLGETPALFTELGYTFRADSTVEPWAGEGFDVLADAERPGGNELVVFAERPVELEERALAVRALVETSRRIDPGLLQGLLYWKLSTQVEHASIEPFVLIVGPDSEDPLQRELLRFLDRSPG